MAAARGEDPAEFARHTYAAALALLDRQRA
jgi:hypothetical protein